MMSDIAETLLRERVIAILRRLRSPRVEAVVDSLRGAGLTCIEITFESEGAADALESLHAAFGDRVHLGAGSIRTAGQAQDAVRAGARYLVSPGLFEEVSAFARARGVLYIPGVLTATEIGTALAWGHRIQKLFPAGLVGPEYLKAMQAPYPEAQFFAVGNIGVEDVRVYLQAGAVGVAMGSQLVGSGDAPEVIARKAAAVVAAIQPRLVP
jgi:2-dehydro-3-deoxyphosphogluconate aldolase / (4S)-4-hydroxy-2-oxoglutarate aldolase